VLLEEQPPTNSYLFLYIPAPRFYTNTTCFGWVWPFHSSVEESLTAPILLAPQQRVLQMQSVSRTWRNRLLGAGAGAVLTLVSLWVILISAAAAAVIHRT